MRRQGRCLILSILALIALLPGAAAHAAMSSANFGVASDVVSAGSGSASSAGYKLKATVGQSTEVGNATSTNFKAGAGFWSMQSQATGSAPAGTDTDGDGLTDAQEASLGTNPAIADTDGDGLSDGYEVATSLTNPLLTDHDGDGYSDGKEVSLGTNPKLATSVPYSVSAATITRSDGGSSADNLVTGNPKADLTYTFTATVKDLSGTPQSVKLLTAQRSSPAAGDFSGASMACTGSFSTGATCTAIMRLGPAAVHKYRIEALTSDGTIVTNSLATGPQIQLLNGYTIAGAARDLTGSSLDGLTAFGSASAYRWVSTGVTTTANSGLYELVDSAKPAKSGVGYFVKRTTTPVTLPELATSPNLTATTHTLALSPGWNLISNPYGGAVLLSALQVKQGTATPVSWSTAATNGWLVNAIYYYKGSDWGGTYGFESAGGAPDATLTPWMGYWVYVAKADATYSIVITKP